MKHHNQSPIKPDTARTPQANTQARSFHHDKIWGDHQNTETCLLLGNSDINQVEILASSHTMMLFLLDTTTLII